LITKELDIPTIGIGAGVHCSGQVLVSYDMLGMNEGFKPRFLKTYDTLADRIKDATGAYVREVKSRVFPGKEHTIGGTAPVPTPIPHDDSSIPLYGGGKK
jgi:3-methyl-2-oxobutanoate hydroxymethyltransferase